MASNWISVDYLLPPSHKLVLALAQPLGMPSESQSVQYIVTAYYVNHTDKTYFPQFWQFDGIEVFTTPMQNMLKGCITHWAYLPEHPEKKDDAPVDLITPEQKEELEHAIGSHIDIAQQLMKQLGVKSLSDIPKVYFRTSMNFIRKNRAAKEGSSF